MLQGMIHSYRKKGNDQMPDGFEQVPDRTSRRSKVPMYAVVDHADAGTLQAARTGERNLALLAGTCSS